MIVTVVLGVLVCCALVVSVLGIVDLVRGMRRVGQQVRQAKEIKREE